MGAEKEYNNVFVSHYHEDEENIGKMRELLGSDYQIKNSSVTSDKFNSVTFNSTTTKQLYT